MRVPVVRPARTAEARQRDPERFISWSHTAKRLARGRARAPHTGGRSEADLISSFIEKIGRLRPQLITFNGHSFDLPVLRYRAMVNRKSGLGLQVRPWVDRRDYCSRGAP